MHSSQKFNNSSFHSNLVRPACAKSCLGGWHSYILALLFMFVAVPTWSQIPTTFFGISLNNATDYPTSSPQFGLLRLWDTPHTDWPSLQSAYGASLSTTSLGYLDDALNGACINSPGYSAGSSCGNAVVMYTFGKVPSWASENSSDATCAYASGECQPPSCTGATSCTHLNADGSGDDAAWRGFLVLLAEHLNGLSSTQYAPLKYFEVWNEIDRSLTFTNNNCGNNSNCSYNGSYAQLLRLNEDMRCVLIGTGTIHNFPSKGSSTTCTAASQSPYNWTVGELNNKTGVKFLSPSSHAQGTTGAIATSTGVVQNFLYCSDSSLPQPNCNWKGTGTSYNWGSGSVDIINFHMKPGNEDKTTDPELEMQNEYNSATAILGTVNNDNTKPFWNGESGYSGASPCGWTPASGGDVDLNSLPVQQAAFAARYMLIQWSLGIQASAWYQYDLSNFLVGDCSGGKYTNNGATTDAYTAFNHVAAWMINSTMSPISGSGTDCQLVGGTAHPTLWGCQLKQGTWTGQVYWDSSTTYSCTGSTDSTCNSYNYTGYPTTPVWHKYQTADGSVQPFSNGTAITVSNLPTIIMTNNPQ
jgi:hypothetical protein